MPLVRIDAAEGRKPEDLAAIGDGVHRALHRGDRHPGAGPLPGHTLPPSRRASSTTPSTWGSRAGADVVFVQITLSVGRRLEQKKALFAAIVRNLGAEPGLRPEDVFINLVEVVKENWSFGNGVAQYAP